MIETLPLADAITWVRTCDSIDQLRVICDQADWNIDRGYADALRRWMPLQAAAIERLRELEQQTEGAS